MKIRQLIFSFMLLCATAVNAQFRSVDWGAVRGDSLLPVCMQVVELPADYNDYTYSASIEYPEFQMMTAEEVARYSIMTRYGDLPEMPAIECYVGVQAKRAQLDVVFLPVVMRGGKYFRINSYKLVVDSQPVLRPQRAAASPAGRYATSSLLASGRWVRVSVEENGVHKITDGELKKMGFSNPSKVRLYGYGGHILPETDLASLPDDLVEIPLWRENGYVLFYANGTIKWTYSNNRYVHSQNVYSTYGCYFLTESEDAPMEFSKVTLQPTADAVYTSYNDYALYEKEKKSLCSYGRVLVDNDAYSSSAGRAKSYSFAIDGALDEAAVVDLSFATGGEIASKVTVVYEDVLGSYEVGSLTIGRVVSGEVGKISESKFSLPGGVAEKSTFYLVHRTDDNSLVGYLDYLRLNFRRSLALRGSSTLFRGDLTGGGNARFEIAGRG